MENTPVTPEVKTMADPIVKVPKKRSSRPLIISLVILSLIVLIVAPFAYTASVLLPMQSRLTTLTQAGQAAVDALKNQDLPTAKVQLDAASAEINHLDSQYKRLAFWGYLPFFKAYYQDAGRVISIARSGIQAGQQGIVAVEPYADVLGLKGAGSFAGGTAEDRLVQLVSTLENLVPAFDQVQTHISSMDQEMSQIDSRRYPFTVSDRSVADLISQAKSTLHQADTMLSQFRPIIASMPEIMGAKTDKKYLLLFQNDAELRATGGFLTAYAVVNVRSGKITPEKSDDMYDLDAKFKEKIAPPEVVKKHLLVSKLNLRDMNLSPDFKLSMDEFMKYYQTLPGEPKVDGVVAIDTQVLTSLLKVLGPIDVPGYGQFTAETDKRCNCPQIIYEMEDIIGRPTPYLRSERKAILGPMMQTILYKAYGAGNEQWPTLFNVLYQNLAEKHILFYFPDTTIQAAVEANNFAGRIQSPQGNYLHINDSNFGGAKSNMFITQEYNLDIKTNGDQSVVTLEMIYKNPMAGSNCNLEAGQLCLNGVLGNWQRVLLPQGSQLIEAKGYLDDSVQTSTVMDKTQIEGFFKLSPESQAKLTLSYSVPYVPSDNQYLLTIQKQPGTKQPKVTVTLNGQATTFDLSTDQTLTLTP